MPTQIILAMKSGACDFLDREASADEIRETIRGQLSQARNGQGKRAGRVIALVGARENDGESEIAANLAAYIASTHPKGDVLLLDLTLEDSQLEIEFNVEITYSVRDAIEEHLRLDRAGLVDVLAKHSSGLCLLPLTTSKSSDGEISPQQIATLLSALRNFFSIIVINAGCLRDKYCRQYVMPLCDQVLLVCPQTIGSIRAARRIMPAKAEGDDPNVRFGLIVSKYDRDIELTPDQMASRIGIALAATLPTSWVSIANSHNLGVPLVFSWSGSRYARAIRAIANDLLDGSLHAKTKTAGPSMFGWLGALKRAVF
jgi:pilus assembly protein CpaE